MNRRSVSGINRSIEFIINKMLSTWMSKCHVDISFLHHSHLKYHTKNYVDHVASEVIDVL